MFIQTDHPQQPFLSHVMLGIADCLTVKVLQNTYCYKEHVKPSMITLILFLLLKFIVLSRQYNGLSENLESRDDHDIPKFL